MKDALGSEINVGTEIIYVDATKNGVHYHLGKVTRLTPKMIGVEYEEVWTRRDGSTHTRTCSYLTTPNRVIAYPDVEQLVKDSNLLRCLEAAGIDNCEAYSIGYRDFLEQEDE